MREIKFRAWDKPGKYFVEHDDLFGTDPYYQNPFMNSEYILLQYTGLKDKNGVEMYEGDIVEYRDYSNGAYFTFSGKDIQPRKSTVIEIDNLFKGVYLPGVGSMNQQRHADKLEITGNIYESPELL